MVVGHSYGGVIALRFAADYPGSVVGVVLIDSSHPAQNEALAVVPELMALQDDEIAGLAGLVAVAEAGELPPELVLAGAPATLSPAMQLVWAEFMVSAKQLQAVLDEYESIDVSLDQAAQFLGLGATPLIVLSRGIGFEEQLPAEVAAAYGLTPAKLALADEAWDSLQANLAGLSELSKRVVAEKSDHYVYLQQPALVEAAVRELVTRAR